MKNVERLMILVTFLTAILWYGSLGVFTFYVTFFTSVAMLIRVICFVFLTSDVFCAIVTAIVLIKYICESR